jgi:hypothetical protein
MADDYELDPRGAAVEFRKHLGWYVKGLPGSADLRKKLYAVHTVAEVEEIFEDYLSRPFCARDNEENQNEGADDDGGRDVIASAA